MQNNHNNKVCRLCLKLVRSSDVAVINEVMREMLRLLLINLDLDMSEHPSVCGTCSKILGEIYLFKSKCLYTEGIISAHIGTSLTVTLRNILVEIENKHDIHIDDDEVVCRLCIKIPLNGSYIALGETGDGISFARDMIQIHLPEVDLSIIEKPIICEVCHVQLKDYASFATNCMAVEGKIKLYCELKKISAPLDLARVLQFTKDKALDLQNSLDKDLVIKQEDDLLLVKVENVRDAEDYVLEDLVDSSSISELYLKNEEIEIKSENDDMSEEIEDSIATVAPNNSGKRGSLKRKRQIRKSPTKGRKYLSSDDHMARHRGRSKTFGCRECKFKTDKKYILARHVDRHKDKSEVEMHKCENCDYMARQKSNLNKHFIAKHRDPRAEREFKCDQCPYETNFKSALRRHNKRHKDKSEVMHKCTNCEFQTRWKHSLIQHMLIHRATKAERRFKCDKCPYKTDIMSSLRSHNLRHSDKSEAMHKCANCEFQTRWAHSLIRHTLMHGDPKAERRFKCDKCPYETDYKSLLRRHNLRHMDKSEVEMHKCENCEYETRYKGDIKKHMGKHRDPKAERKFKCNKCPYESDYKSTLGKHSLRHMDKSEVQMHKCQNCEYETKRKVNLSQHMLTHRDQQAERNFKCDKCPYETDIKSRLPLHYLKHMDKSEVEIYKCVNCEYETKWKGALRKHSAKHDSIAKKQFKCDKYRYEILLEHSYSLLTSFPVLNY